MGGTMPEQTNVTIATIGSKAHLSLTLIFNYRIKYKYSKLQ